jgi:hypothetical protein
VGLWGFITTESKDQLDQGEEEMPVTPGNPYAMNQDIPICVCVLMEEANAPLSSPPQTQPPHPFFYLNPSFLSLPFGTTHLLHKPESSFAHKFTFLLCSQKKL